MATSTGSESSECCSFTYFAVLALIVFLLYRFGSSLKQRLLAAFYVRYAGKDISKKLKPIKEQLFESLSEIKSHDPKLLKEGVIRILEIGPGPGNNFEFFPKNCRVICYDKNGYFRDYLSDNSTKFPSVKVERFIVSPAEDLKETDDESVDVVVSTLVNCSVDDVDRVHQEILRVLAPGGKYYFLEHVKAAEHTSTFYFQKLIRPIFWAFMDCDVHRDLASSIKKSGFSKVEITEFIVNMNMPFGLIIKDFIRGSAMKHV